MPVHCRVTPSMNFIGTHLKTWVERGTGRLQHNVPTRPWAQTVRSGDHLLLLTGSIMWIDHCKEIWKLTFESSNEELMLKMSAFKSLYGGQFILSTQLIKPNYLVILPTNAAPQFVWKLNTPLFIISGVYCTNHEATLVFQKRVTSTWTWAMNYRCMDLYTFKPEAVTEGVTMNPYLLILFLTLHVATLA